MPNISRSTLESLKNLEKKEESIILGRDVDSDPDDTSSKKFLYICDSDNDI